MADDRGCSLGAVGLAFVGGGLVGAAMALLLAPQSGRKSREQVHELADTTSQALNQAVNKGREFMKDKQAVVTEAIEAGRVALSRERERLSGEAKV